ncbi:hypothetical protein BH10BAC4_BH10BAC4_25950 [soil metagenome]
MHFRSISLLAILPLFGLVTLQTATAQQFAVKEPLIYAQKELWFDKIVSRENTSLINGPEYFIPFQGATTHPFFGSRELTNEEVRYDAQLYENVFLLYDIYSDVLVLRIRDHSGLFALVHVDKAKVESFTLYQHRFRKMMDPKSTSGETTYSFYNVLAEGKNIMLVARRTKTRQVLAQQTEYEIDDKYYFVRDGKWSLLSGTKSYYELMEAEESQITGFIKSQHIKVRKRDEKDLIAIAVFCNSLEVTK